MVLLAIRPALKDNRMPRSTNLNKPVAMLGMPEPPADLDAAGQRLWKRTLGARPAAEWTAADCTLLALHVRAALDVARLDQEIEEAGEVITTGNGGSAVHPLVMVRARREKLLLDTANRLKLSPSTRYTSRRNAELARHAGRALRAGEALEADDLLAAPSRERMQ